MAAQFFSSLADNALLFVAIDLLTSMKAPASLTPLLKLLFVLFYVLLAAFVGAFADALPKGRVMFIANLIKIVGCLLIFVHVHPLVAYAVVGFGAAVYSPAKYGILTELLPPEKLVAANGWIEGLTVTSIILGTVLGGTLVGRAHLDLPARLRHAVDRHRHRHADRSGAVRGGRHLHAGGAVQPAHSRHRRALRPPGAQPDQADRRFRQLLGHAVERQAGPDFAGRDHAVLGRRRHLAADRAEVGREVAAHALRTRRPAWSAWSRSASRSARPHRRASSR